MRVLVINGSPKGENSNTMNITRAFLSGFPEDAEIELADLSKLEIKPCRGCYSCWSRTPGKCVIRDDMQEIYKKIEAADVIIESFGLYFFGMPGTLKTLTDRCLPLMQPYDGDLSADGSAGFHNLRDEKMHSKKLVVISTCGYVIQEPMFKALTAQLDLICKKDNYTAIFCPEGEIFFANTARRQKDGYLSDIKKAGAEFAENGFISPETLEKISRPILSPEGFKAITAGHWEHRDKIK